MYSAINVGLEKKTVALFAHMNKIWFLLSIIIALFKFFPLTRADFFKKKL